MESNPTLKMLKSEADKSPEHIAFEDRMLKTKKTVELDIAEYKTKLNDGTFESDENLKKSFQERIARKIQKLEGMKQMIDRGEIPLEESLEPIEVEYKYTDPDTGKVERHETITIDIEKEIADYISLFEEKGIPIPSDFEDGIKSIWKDSYEEIQKAIEEVGFDGVIIAPANIPIEELSQKLKIENGYADYITKRGSTVALLTEIPLESVGVNKPHLILVHKSQNLKDRPELKKTLGVKAQDVSIEESLSLEDYIIFQNKYFKETGKHLDENGWTWTPRTKSGARFVNSSWFPSASGLNVGADGADDSGSYLGCRPSRYFV